jgi:hypothetical protein
MHCEPPAMSTCSIARLATSQRARGALVVRTAAMTRLTVTICGASRLRCARRRSPALAKANRGVRFNDHLQYDNGEIVFRHACKMGLEGIVSKRKDSPYRSGRSSDWLKMKNPGRNKVGAGPSRRS